MLDLLDRNVEAWAEALASRDGHTRQTAREQLVGLGPPAAPLLNQLLKDDRKRVRWEAALGLKDLADPSSVSALLAALEDDDGDVRWVAAEALAAIGEPSLPPLLTTLSRRADSLELREGAHLVISCLDDPDQRVALDPVQKALGRKTSPEMVMLVAHQVLMSWPPWRRS